MQQLAWDLEIGSPVSGWEGGKPCDDNLVPVQAAYYDASVVLADHEFVYDDEERQEVYTKIDTMEGEMKSTIDEEELINEDEAGEIINI